MQFSKCMVAAAMALTVASTRVNIAETQGNLNNQTIKDVSAINGIVDRDVANSTALFTTTFRGSAAEVYTSVYSTPPSIMVPILTITATVITSTITHAISGTKVIHNNPISTIYEQVTQTFLPTTTGPLAAGPTVPKSNAVLHRVPSFALMAFGLLGLAPMV